MAHGINAIIDVRVEPGLTRQRLCINVGVLEGSVEGVVTVHRGDSRGLCYILKDDLPLPLTEGEDPLRPFHVSPLSVHESDLEGEAERVSPLLHLLTQVYPVLSRFAVILRCRRYLRVADPVEPLPLKLCQGEARNLFKTGEELIGIGVAAEVTVEIETLPLLKCIRANDEAEHPDNLGRLHVGHPVDQLVGLVETFPHDTAVVPPILYCQRPQER